MTAYSAFRLFYRIRRLHMSPVRAALVAAWYAIKPVRF
jgi:hypothetical protein